MKAECVDEKGSRVECPGSISPTYPGRLATDQPLTTVSAVLSSTLGSWPLLVIFDVDERPTVKWVLVFMKSMIMMTTRPLLLQRFCLQLLALAGAGGAGYFYMLRKDVNSQNTKFRNLIKSDDDDERPLLLML